MSRSRRTRALILVSLLAVTAASVGLVLAAAGKRPAPRPRPLAPGQVDCKALDARLRTCAVHLVATVDPEAPGRLAKMEPALRKAVRSTMADELLSRVGGACHARKGQMDGGPPVARCLEQAAAAEKADCPASGPDAKPEACAAHRKGKACEAFATCLKAAYATLPKPKPSPEATP